MDSHRPALRLAAEDDSHRAEIKRGGVDPEDVWILLIVRVQYEAFVYRRNRSQNSKRQLTAPDEDLGSQADHGPQPRAGSTGRQLVPGAEIAPDLRVLRH